MNMNGRDLTRRTGNLMDEMRKEFDKIYCVEDFRSKFRLLEMSAGRSDRPTHLANLYRMMEACGIDFEKGRDIGYYREIVEKAGLPGVRDLEDLMPRVIYTRFDSYPSPVDYMKRIVDTLCDAEDGWNGDPLRLRILKQFIKYGGYLKEAGYGGRNAIRKYVREQTGRGPGKEDITAFLDDGVFSLLENASREQANQDGKFGLLKVADDLAGAKFRTEGATRKHLYYFAMVYGMTYHEREEEKDPISDIEINLFRDYYANNLMRFITDAYRKGYASEFEADPSGQGINFKNFAEVIYLYYLCADMPREEKVARSSAMIESIRKERFNKEQTDSAAAGGTEHFRDLLSGEMFSLPEDEFRNFVIKNYDCDTCTGSHTERKSDPATEELKEVTVYDSTGVFNIEKEQRSAGDEYQKIMDALRREAPPEDWRYGLWFDIKSLEKRWREEIPPEEENKFNDFIILLRSVDKFLRPPRDLAPDKVTRTAMIVAYYYLFNASHEKNSGIDYTRWESFGDVFNSYRADLDRRLENANYQKLSAKNIFDVLIVFSSFAFLNN